MSTHPTPLPRRAPAGRSGVLAVLLLVLAGLGCVSAAVPTADPTAAPTADPAAVFAGHAPATPHCPLHDPTAVFTAVAPQAAVRPGTGGDAPGPAASVAAGLLAPVLPAAAVRRRPRGPDGRRLLLVLRVSRR